MIVLDCNAAVAILRGIEEGRALQSLMMEGEEVIAPDFFRVELGNSIAKYVRCGQLDTSRIESSYKAGVNLVDAFYPAHDLMVESMGEAARLRHSVYDMLYLVLARREGATLFTLDQKLQNLCLGNGVNCVFLDKEF